MKSTHFRDDHAEIVKHQALGYSRSRTAFRLSVTNFDTVGATSLLTTVEDLALWDENFYQPKVGGKALLAQQLQTGKLNNGQPLEYAFGLQVTKYRGLPIIDHSGADAGYRADLLRFPQQHFSVACLCNLSETSPVALTRKVADLYLSSEFKEPDHASHGAGEKSVTLTEQQLSRYPGMYWNREDERALTVTLRDGKLYRKSPPNQEFELAPVSDSRFRMLGPPIDVSVVFDRPKPDAGLRMLIQPEESTQPASLRSSDGVQAHSPRQLNDYVGEYRSREIDPVYRIVVKENGLALLRLKSSSDKLTPAVKDYFRASVGSLHFVRNPGGIVSGFLLNTGRIQNFQFTKTAAVIEGK